MSTAADRAWAVLAERRFVVLTGAGVSTDSGIPDYRGPTSPNRTPMTYGEFVSGPAAQQRYWARSHVGWRRLARAQPNDGHRAIAAMEAAGRTVGLITQNVDGLHAAAGSRNVIDLHGRIADVICLDCHRRTSRTVLHRRLDLLNPRFAADLDIEQAPDGDALLEHVDGFRMAGCEVCGGPLKPDVIFFGENVPPDRVARCAALVDEAGALLVAGSSLTVMSGFRFVRQAHRRGTPVVIVNRGPTRADDRATVKIDAGCSETLREMVAFAGIH